MDLPYDPQRSNLRQEEIKLIESVFLGPDSGSNPAPPVTRYRIHPPPSNTETEQLIAGFHVFPNHAHAAARI
jgi:hypothetical protein